ncbi:MAG: S41 family peptidase [Muribaculaceae bacterium]|nr:S41 family peptidase [Muribaculaceae bacterium]
MKRLLYFLLGAATTGIVAWAAPKYAEQKISPDHKLRMAEAIIENYYVEDVNTDTLVSEAIVAMLKTLDPHSAYSTPAETEELNQPLEGKFSGIGIQFNMVEDTVYVIQTTQGGPSEKVGIRPGDRIISANDTVIAGKKLTNSGIIKVLRGPKGSPVNLKVKRGGVSELIDFNLIRDDIPIYSVDAAYMVDDSTGYVSVTRFAEATGAEVRRAVDSLSNLGMRNLILDLQSNGGGYLGSAFEMASDFLRPGDPVVSTRGLHAQPQMFSVQQSAFLPVDRLVVMVDQYSASASEILSGAIQENDRGLVVGRRTFGKGLVQRPFPFPDGSMIRLTTARYYTPTGRCIQKPYVKGHTEEYQLDLLNRYKSGELWHVDSVMLDSADVYYTLHNRRPVYGGGGIMPDVFVPVDTSYYTPYYRDMVAKGSIMKYALGYIEKHRAELLKKYPDEESFAAKFPVTEEMTKGLIARGETDGVKFNQEQWNTSRPLLEAILRGLMTRDLYENGIYVRSTHPLSPEFREAHSLINDPERYYRLLKGK